MLVRRTAPVAAVPAQLARRASTQTKAPVSVEQSLKDTVRLRDYPAFLTHFAYPRALQPHFFALRAFHVELASIKDMVSNELVGRVRMQWWRDAIRGIYQDRPPKHPVALGLRDAVFDPRIAATGGLVEDHFLAIIDAREADLGDPLAPPSLVELEQYAESTSSRMLYLLLNLQGISERPVDEIFSHLGKAMGLSILVGSLPFHTHPPARPRTGGGNIPGMAGGSRYAPQGNVVPRTPTLPLPLEYLLEFNVTQEDVFRNGIHAHGLRDAIFYTATRANDYLITARTQLRDAYGSCMPEAAVAPMLMAVHTREFLKRLEKYDFNPYDARCQQRSWLLPCNQIGQRFDTKTERFDMMLGSTAPKRKTRNFKGLLLKDTSVSHTEHVSPLDESGRSSTRLMRSLEEPQDGAPYDNLGGIALGPRAATRLELPDWFSPTLRHPTSSAHAGSDARPEAAAKAANGSGSSAPRSSTHSSAPSSQGSNELSQRMNGLDLQSEEDAAQRLELKNSNLRTLCELGAGNGGTVSKVVHIPTGIVMAKKVVFIDAKPEVRKQILRELQILHECQSQYIVGFYGACLSDIHIYMCMEYMDAGSLDSIYSKHGAIDVDVCGKIVVTVVQGLSYLYEVHRIIHRDVKPSNILVNLRGEIKLCDFGVSGELINSIADTFVGTSTYMSPERIQGDQYSIKSDVWSLGITMIELAHGCFPFALDGEEDTLHAPGQSTTTAASAGKSAQEVRAPRQAQPMSILELLQHIVYEPPPRLNPEMHFPPLMVDFVNLCLSKDPAVRPTPMALRQHAYVRQSDALPVDLAAWVHRLGYRAT
ncbi:mitogen-activated protein kinase kinase [Malassezia brasiliensis]|uniref:Mitogen-activated protein kinase kinase n=1 Tax=Malassezia brasiliensis TaxID=1821822 RepID=A0AAF0DVN1_9BASI|nr:mitogen-activated protein kinase kinase [Malassezia brasiliensis]